MQCVYLHYQSLKHCPVSAYLSMHLSMYVGHRTGHTSCSNNLCIWTVTVWSLEASSLNPSVLEEFLSLGFSSLSCKMWDMGRQYLLNCSLQNPSSDCYSDQGRVWVDGLQVSPSSLLPEQSYLYLFGWLWSWGGGSNGYEAQNCLGYTWLSHLSGRVWSQPSWDS